MQQSMVQDTFTITPKGPYLLAESRVFLEGFTPAAYKGAGQTDHLHLEDETHEIADGGQRKA